MKGQLPLRQQPLGQPCLGQLPCNGDNYHKNTYPSGYFLSGQLHPWDKYPSGLITPITRTTSLPDSIRFRVRESVRIRARVRARDRVRGTVISKG